MSDLFELDGSVVVVTGGAGCLGRCFTAALVRYGARVAVLDVAGTGSISGDSVLGIDADVCDRGVLEDALERITDLWGVPSGLVNAAALDSPPDAPATENGPFEDYPQSSWRAVMETNVTGVFTACQVFGSAMARAGRGSIVNISSTYGMVSPDQRIYEYRRARGDAFFKPIAYSVSKSALFNLTRYLATYWARDGVRVNTLTLGGVYAEQDPEFLKEYCARVPLGRMADEHEYDGAVIFLLSHASAYMTGANLVVDGGWTSW